MNMNKVNFSDNLNISLIYEDKSYNYNENYTDSKRYMNRLLYKMEKFFHKMDLLQKGEMLDISHDCQKHIRVPFIECIARDKGWIYGDEFIHIITK